MINYRYNGDVFKATNNLKFQLRISIWTIIVKAMNYVNAQENNK